MSPMANGQNQNPAAAGAAATGLDVPGIASPWTLNAIPMNRRDVSPAASRAVAEEMVIGNPYLCHRLRRHIAALQAAAVNLLVRCHYADPGHCNVTPNHSRHVHSHESDPNDDPQSQLSGYASEFRI